MGNDVFTRERYDVCVILSKSVKSVLKERRVMTNRWRIMLRHGSAQESAMTLLSSPTKVGELAEPSGISLHVTFCRYDSSPHDHHVSDDPKSAMGVFLKNSGGRGSVIFVFLGRNLNKLLL